MNTSPAHPAAFDPRVQAARLLRLIRNLGVEESAEHVGWALMLLPDHLPVIRLAIDVHLAQNNISEAEALIAQALIRFPRSLALRLGRARCLLLRGRTHLAAVELRYLAQARPAHISTLHLASSTMRELDHHNLAAQYLVRAATQCRPDHRLAHAILRTLLECAMTDAAAELLSRLESPPPALHARLLWAQGRTLEALELLESALKERSADGDEVLTLLIRLYHQVGRADAIRELLQGRWRLSAGAVEAAARALLSAGSPRTAARLCARSLREHRRLLPTLGPTLMAALLAHNRPRLALRVLALIRASSPQEEAPQFLPVWPLYFECCVSASQATGRHTGADPNPSMLDSLLRRSLHALDLTMKSPSTLPSSEFSDLALLRERCAIALQQISRGQDAGLPLDIPSPARASALAPERADTPMTGTELFKPAGSTAISKAA